MPVNTAEVLQHFDERSIGIDNFFEYAQYVLEYGNRLIQSGNADIATLVFARAFDNADVAKRDALAFGLLKHEIIDLENMDAKILARATIIAGANFVKEFTYDTPKGFHGFDADTAIEYARKNINLYSKLCSTYFQCEEQYRQQLVVIMSSLLISYSKTNEILSGRQAGGFSYKEENFKAAWQNAALQKWAQTCIEQLDNISTPGLKHKIDSKSMESYRNFCIGLWIGVNKGLMETGNRNSQYADILFKLIRARTNPEVRALFENWQKPTDDWSIFKTLVAALANTITLTKDQLKTLFMLTVSLLSISAFVRTQKYTFEFLMQDQNADVLRSFVLFLSQSNQHQEIRSALTIRNIENVTGITKTIEELSKVSMDTATKENILVTIIDNITFVNAYILEQGDYLAPSMRADYLEQNRKLMTAASEIITSMQNIPESLSAFINKQLEINCCWFRNNGQYTL